MQARFKAFALHLFISALIALGVIAIVFGLWYPSPLHEAAGVTHIFLILLGVDVCLGPLLTLIVYKSGKKTLMMDLTIIVLLQLSALIYGLHTMAEGRPAWLVFNVDRFDLVRVNDIDERKLNDAALEYQSSSWFGPQWVAAKRPEGGDERNTLMFEAVMAGVDISARPNYYQPLEVQLEVMQQHGQPLNNLVSFNSADRIQNELGEQWQHLPYVFLPLKAKNQDMVVLVNSDNGEPIKIINLRPW